MFHFLTASSCCRVADHRYRNLQRTDDYFEKNLSRAGYMCYSLAGRWHVPIDHRKWPCSKSLKRSSICHALGPRSGRAVCVCLFQINLVRCSPSGSIMNSTRASLYMLADSDHVPTWSGIPPSRLNSRRCHIRFSMWAVIRCGMTLKWHGDSLENEGTDLRICTLPGVRASTCLRQGCLHFLCSEMVKYLLRWQLISRRSRGAPHGSYLAEAVRRSGVVPWPDA